MNHKPTVRDYLGISLFWFALSFFWGAMLTMVLPEIVKQLVGDRYKDLALTLVSSVGALVATGSQIFFGAWSDQSKHRMGRRQPFLIVGTLLTTFALFLFPQARSLTALVGAYIAIQFCLNIATGPYQALIPDLIPFSHHGTASAYMGICTLLGRIGGPLAVVLLLEGDSQRGLLNLMIVFAIFLNLFMALNVLLVREKPLTEPGQGLRETLKKSFVVPLRPYPSFIWLLYSRFMIMMGVYAVNFCLLYYVEDTLGFKNQGMEIVKWFLILATLTGLVSTVPAGMLSDRYSKKTVLYISNIISIAAGFLFLMAHSLTPAYIAVGIFGAGFAAFTAVDWALGCNLLPPREPAKYMGVWSIADIVPQIVAPVIAGSLAFILNRQFGSGAGYRWVMGLAMLFFVIGTVMIRNIRERTVPVGNLKQEEPESLTMEAER
jgi:Na+/melibiose symporter-like transporter